MGDVCWYCCLLSRSVDGGSRRSSVRTSVQYSSDLRADIVDNSGRTTLISVIGPYASEEIAKAVWNRWRNGSRSVLPRMAFGQALAAATGRRAWHDFGAVLGPSLRHFELVHEERTISLKRRDTQTPAAAAADGSKQPRSE
jgi:hypothetical protein